MINNGTIKDGEGGIVCLWCPTCNKLLPVIYAVDTNYIKCSDCKIIYEVKVSNGKILLSNGRVQNES